MPLFTRCSSSSARDGKRQGAGKGNWGKSGDDAEVSADVAAEVAAEESPAAAAPAADAPAEPKTVSFDEWKRQKEAASIKVDSSKLRKANEGADNAQWANAVAINAAEASDEEDDEHEGSKKTQRSARKQYVPVAFSFRPAGGDFERPERSERTERGGRGRGRGGRGLHLMCVASASDRWQVPRVAAMPPMRCRPAAMLLLLLPLLLLPRPRPPLLLRASPRARLVVAVLAAVAAVAVCGARTVGAWLTLMQVASEARADPPGVPRAPARARTTALRCPTSRASLTSPSCKQRQRPADNESAEITIHHLCAR